MPQPLGAIAGGDRRDGLTSDADWIVAAVVGAACSRGDFLLVGRISWRADGANSPEHLLNHFVARGCTVGR